MSVFSRRKGEQKAVAAPPLTLPEVGSWVHVFVGEEAVVVKVERTGTTDFDVVDDAAVDQVGRRRDVVRAPGGQVVEHDDVSALPDERIDQMRSDEPGTAGDHDLHPLSVAET